MAVIVSEDGRTAYLADSAPGDVYAVSMPELKIAWKSHVGGAPFGLLLHGGTLLVSLFDRAQIDELDPADGRVIATRPTPIHPAALTVDPSGGLAVAAAGGFGIAAVAQDVWTADYKGGTIVDLTRQRTLALPLALAPFWLAPGSSQILLIAAEGASEDSDPGAVFSYRPRDGTFATLARPRDPDQVLASGSMVLVAAHGDHQVLAIGGGATHGWARGAAAVALAPDPRLGLLAVAVNAHE